MPLYLHCCFKSLESSKAPYQQGPQTNKLESRLSLAAGNTGGTGSPGKFFSSFYIWLDHLKQVCIITRRTPAALLLHARNNLPRLTKVGLTARNRRLGPKNVTQAIQSINTTLFVYLFMQFVEAATFGCFKVRVFMNSAHLASSRRPSHVNAPTGVSENASLNTYFGNAAGSSNALNSTTAWATPPVCRLKVVQHNCSFERLHHENLTQDW